MADPKIFGITLTTGVGLGTEGSAGFAGGEEGTWKELQAGCSRCAGWFIKQPEPALVPEVSTGSLAGTLYEDVCVCAHVVRPSCLPTLLGGFGSILPIQSKIPGWNRLKTWFRPSAPIATSLLPSGLFGELNSASFLQDVLGVPCNVWTCPYLWFYLPRGLPSILCQPAIYPWFREWLRSGYGLHKQ